jgi:hypothetical protein
LKTSSILLLQCSCLTTSYNDIFPIVVVYIWCCESIYRVVT